MSHFLKVSIGILILSAIVFGAGAFLLGARLLNHSPPVPVQPANNQSAPAPNITMTPPQPVFSDPRGLGPVEAKFYDEYLTRVVKPTGAAASNVVPVSWCPNACIGCDGDVTSETVSYSFRYAAMTKDKPIADRYESFYYNTMKHPGTGFMMWKINSDGSVGSCGGQNSAVDAELNTIEGLQYARAQWSVDSQGHSYADTQRLLMKSLASGIITTSYGMTLPHCMYPTSNDPATAQALPCGDTGGKPLVYTGYLNLRALKAMAQLDPLTWQPVYEGSKKLSIASIQDGGVKTSYELATGTFGEREHYIHNLWVVKHILQDGSPEALAAAKPLYDQARAQYYQDGKICDEFNPGSGCKPGTRTGAYAETLSMAVALHDDQFVRDLTKTLQARCAINELGEGTVLCGPDNYGNVVPLQAFADARNSGYTVG